MNKRYHRTVLSQHGFTLLELVLAVSLLGMLLVGLYTGFWVGVRAWDQGSQRSEQLDELRSISSFIRQQLSQTSRSVIVEDGNERRIAFTGEGQSLIFVAPLLPHIEGGGLFFQQLSLKGSDLELSWWPYRPKADGETPDVKRRVLLQGVTRFSCQYFGNPEAKQEQSQWLDQWQSRVFLPQLIQIEWATRDGALPSMTIAVRASS